MDWISRSPHADSLRRGAKVAPIFWSSASPMARRAAAFPPVAARPCAALKADTAASKSAEAVPSMGPVKCPRSRRANFCSGIPAPSVSCSAKRSYQKPSSCRSSAFIEPARVVLGLGADEALVGLEARSRHPHLRGTALREEPALDQPVRGEGVDDEVVQVVVG